MDDSHLKAHFRLAKCLFELSWVDEALDCLTLFKSKFPDYATSQTCEALEKDIRAAVFAKTEQGGDCLFTVVLLYAVIILISAIVFLVRNSRCSCNAM